VFELGSGGGGDSDGGATTAPGPVLATVLRNLDAAAASGDAAAAHLRARLAVLVAGGDGTVAWVLGTLADLAAAGAPGAASPPPVTILPLGTGNDLALSFGWGTRFERAWIADHAALYASLERIARGGVRDLDTWRITLSREGGLAAADTFPALPHSLAVVEGEKRGGGEGGSGPPPPPSATGRFWNYFSLGPDAAAAYGFHSLRERRPWAAPGRAINRLWYGIFSCFTGWYCGGAPARARVSLRARRPTGPRAGEWVDVPLPVGVKGVAVLNLQSYAGGSDHWGLRDGTPPPPGTVAGCGGLGPGAAVARSEDVWIPGEGSGLPAPAEVEAAPVSPAGPGLVPPLPPPPPAATTTQPAPSWSQPIFNDGLVEVIGFKSGWHFGLTMAGLSPRLHAVRLAQAAEVELEVRAGAAGGCGGAGNVMHFQVDGEPWAQPLPEAGDAPLRIRIAHEGAARMLFNGVRLAGVAPKIRRLAERERTVSLGVQRRLTSTASLAAEVGGGLLGGRREGMNSSGHIQLVNGGAGGGGADQARRPSRLGPAAGAAA